MTTEKYSFNDQTDEVFIFSAEENAYLFCGHRNGLSKKEFVSRCEIRHEKYGNEWPEQSMPEDIG